MNCIKCGAQLEEGARFCNMCGESQPVSSAPVYEQPPQAPPPQEPVYAPPVYEQPPQAPPPQEPVYAPPVYEQPPQAPPPQEPVYAPPVYEQPPQAPPPQEPAYAPPAYEQPPQAAAPQAPPYAPPGYQTPYGATPQETGYPAGQGMPYQGGATPPPTGKGNKKKLLMILIPVAAVVVVVLVLFLLELFNVIDIIPSFPDNGGSSISGEGGQDRDRDRPGRGDNDEDEDRRENEGDSGNTGAGTSPTTTAPAPTDNPPAGPGDTSGNAATFNITGVTVVEYRPNRSGVYVIETTDNIDCDPVLYLYDSAGNQVAYDDDGGVGSNSAMGVFLNQGETYGISAQFYGSLGGGYTLTVSPAQTMSDNGGSVVVDSPSWFAFTPNQTGLWQIFTSDNQDCDPILFLFDASNKQLAYDDDGGDEYNSLINIGLVAGETYVIKSTYYSNYGGRLTLNVVFIQSGGELTGNGGEVMIVGPSVLTFTPNESTIWSLYTSDNGTCDPILSIYNSDYSVDLSDDDGGPGYNSFIVVYLEAGESYTIEAGNYGNESHAVYILSVVPVGFYNLGSVTLVIDYQIAYYIRPERSGEWVFETTHNEADPLLRLYNIYGELIAYDDDGGEDANARLAYMLEADTVYIIVAACYGGWGSYDLIITSG